MKVNLLGSRIDALNLEQTVDKIAGFVRSGRPHWIITINPEFIYRAQFEPELMELACRADLVTPDGVGVVWAAGVAGTPVPERVTGIDLMLHLMERAASEGWRVYLIGSAPGVAAEAAECLMRDYPGLQVAGTHHGYFGPEDEAEILAHIKQCRPHLLMVALGAPKQEMWIDRVLPELGVSVAMGVGGSLDVIAGRVPRAPVWMQKLHIEWLGRLLQQPSRWRRMLVLPRFAWLVFKRYRLRRG